MPSISEIQINIVSEFIRHVQTIYSEYPYEANRLLLILKIYRWYLRQDSRSLTFDELMTLKTGVRQSESLLEDLRMTESGRMRGWYIGCSPQNQAQKLANLVWQIVLELTKEIERQEAQYPELKFAFDREREQYRIRLQEAREAEALE